jgi:hypothetical protein
MGDMPFPSSTHPPSGSSYDPYPFGFFSWSSSIAQSKERKTLLRTRTWAFPPPKGTTTSMPHYRILVRRYVPSFVLFMFINTYTLYGWGQLIRATHSQNPDQFRNRLESRISLWDCVPVSLGSQPRQPRFFRVSRFDSDLIAACFSDFCTGQTRAGFPWLLHIRILLHILRIPSPPPLKESGLSIQYDAIFPVRSDKTGGPLDGMRSVF